jgi:hypothetical protein
VVAHANFTGDPAWSIQVMWRDRGSATWQRRFLSGNASVWPGVLLGEDGSAAVTWGHARGPGASLSLRRPGGGFETPEPVPESGPMAFDGDGSLTLAWRDETGIRTAVRTPTGAGFFQTTPEPQGSGFPLALEREADGDLLMLSVRTDPAGSRGIFVSEGRGGAFRPQTLVRETDSAILATGPDGDAAILWADRRSGEIGMRRRTADGELGPVLSPFRGVTDSGCRAVEHTYLESLQLDAEGGGFVRWRTMYPSDSRSTHPCDPSRLLIGELTPAGQVINVNEVQDTNGAVAVNAAGQAAYAEGRHRDFARGAFRAGEAFGAFVDLTRGELPGGEPQVVIDDAGTATAVWDAETEDGEALFSRDFTADGPGEGRFLSYGPPTVPANERYCAPERSVLLQRTAEATLYRPSRRSREKLACSLESRALYELGADPRGGPTPYKWTGWSPAPPAMDLVGPFLVHLHWRGERTNRAYWGVPELKVLDTRDGGSHPSFRPRRRLDPTRRGRMRVPRLTMSLGGTVAWTACAGSRRECRRPGSPTSVWVLEPRGEVPRRVTRGTEIAPLSLRLIEGARRVRVTWEERGATRSQRLR